MNGARTKAMLDTAWLAGHEAKTQGEPPEMPDYYRSRRDTYAAWMAGYNHDADAPDNDT